MTDDDADEGGETLVRSETVYFKIEGEWLSNFVRARVQEGAWGHALQVLQQIDGLSQEQMLQMLQGEFQLCGMHPDEELRYERVPEDVRLKHVHQVARTYAGRFRVGDVWYKPVLKVMRDPKYMKLAGNPLTVPEGWHLLRVREGAFQNKFKAFWGVLAEPCGAPPYWMEDIQFTHPTTGIVAAVEEHERVLGKLEEVWGNPVGTTPRSRADVEQAAARAVAKRRLAKGAPTEEEQEELAALKKEQEVVAESEDAAFDREVEEARAAVLKQAGPKPGPGWMELPVEGHASVLVPKAAFERYALARTSGYHLAWDAWKPCARSGWKMGADDSAHTDALLGAGIPLEHAYDLDKHVPGLDRAWWRAYRRVQAEKLTFEVAVLRGSGVVEGDVVHARPGQAVPKGCVAVVPTLDAEYTPLLGSAAAIVAERGGMGAHLVKVGGEFDVRIVVVEDALRKYREGVKLVVDCDKGRVRFEDWRVFYDDEDVESASDNTKEE